MQMKKVASRGGNGAGKPAWRRSGYAPQDFGTDITVCPPETLFERLKTSVRGLSGEEARNRLEEYGTNELARPGRRAAILHLIFMFVNPLVIVLLVIAGISFYFGERVSALLVSMMAVISVLLSFIQERKAGREAEKLGEMVRATATIIRDGKPRETKMKEIIPGDIVDLFAGDMIPADLRIITAKDLFINQASLTGESFPAEKVADPPPSAAGEQSADTRNVAYMGTSVVSGSGIGVVFRTGRATKFGELSARLSSIGESTSFDRGIRDFTYLMIRFMIVLVLVIFGVNAWLKGTVLEAFMFSLAVAIGLTPEMLPMLVALNLSKGAIAMSRKDVIVKRLSAIQNFGAMDVLCTDKTGTLTMDKIVLEKYCDVVRREDDTVLRLAFLNSFYQTGLKNILDKAILAHEKNKPAGQEKVDEMPFDFSRKIMSVVVTNEGKHRLIAKGAPEEIFKRCTRYQIDNEENEMNELVLVDLQQEYRDLSSEGFRVLAVAYRDFDGTRQAYSRDDEQDLVLAGYLAFLDPPKPSTKRTIEVLKGLGIDFKVLTGDNELVTRKICGDIGIDVTGMVNGDAVEDASDAGLREVVRGASVFARLSPLQKERVIRALHANGHIVGYLGDGINDAAALKSADIGISVNNAVDIAKESADIILLRKSLMILADGVVEGRKTFGNILKYIKMGSSSNFGNMISMTGASIFLPFLPMAPIQVLLNNFLYDMSQVAIPSDEVDGDYLKKSRPWNVAYIKKFMVYFGPISSLFDFITFGVLLYFFHADKALFQTGWFLESICTQTLVIHVIRTSKVPFLESRPSQFLVFTSIYIVSAALVLPFLPLGASFKFVMPPATFFVALVLIVGAYLLAVQWMKNRFIRKYGYE